MRMADGTIIPSYLGVASMGSNATSDAALLTNYVLRYGEIKTRRLPTDPNSISKTQIEYDVEVVHREDLGANSIVLYRGVTVSNLFGGFADRLDYTFRVDTLDSKDGVGNGSKVLLLCVSGDQSKAVILGGVRDTKLQPQKSEDEGHNLFFEFNGAQFTVNNDGEVQFLHRGKTEVDGTVTDSLQEYTGSLVHFDKSGNIIISGPDGKQFFKLYNVNPDDSSLTGSIQVQADNKLIVNTNGTTELVSNDTFDIKSKNSSIKMNAQQGVLVGSATDKWIKGTTYRTAEGTLNKTLASSYQSAAAIAATASAGLITAAGMNAIPLVGGILALPGFTAVASQLAALGAIFGVMGGAINAFEGGAETYLSTKNYTD